MQQQRDVLVITMDALHLQAAHALLIDMVTQIRRDRSSTHMLFALVTLRSLNAMDSVIVHAHWEVLILWM